MPESICIPEPPPSACGSVKERKIYLRGQGGGGWGGGSGGTNLKFVAIWPAAGDDSGAATKAQRTALRLVDIDAVLAYAPEPDWLIGNSKTNWLDRQWELHEVTVFGMPAKERLDHGILDGVTTVAEAQVVLTALRPSPSAWRNTLGAIKSLSGFTVKNEQAHPLVLAAYAAHQQDKPFLVLARLHELLRQKRLPNDVLIRALAVMEYIAPDDMFWMQMESVDATF